MKNDRWLLGGWAVGLIGCCLLLGGCPADTPVDTADSENDEDSDEQGETTVAETQSSTPTTTTPGDTTSTDPTTTTLDPTTGGEACGNGVLEGDEQCDDGDDNGRRPACSARLHAERRLRRRRGQTAARSATTAPTTAT
jgi:cysteine-rich repeat protein